MPSKAPIVATTGRRSSIVLVSSEAIVLRRWCRLAGRRCRRLHQGQPGLPGVPTAVMLGQAEQAATGIVHARRAVRRRLYGGGPGPAVAEIDRALVRDEDGRQPG